MNSLKNRIWLAALLTLIFLPCLVQAQVPSLREIPWSLGPVERYHELLHKRNALLTRRSDLISKVSAHNAQCSQVPEDSPQAQTCKQMKAALETEKTNYIDAVNKFNAELEEAIASWTSQHAKVGPQIGGAAMVEGEVFWITSSGQKVIVKPGTPLFLNEHIETGPGARLQVLLLDKSVFTLGPNSEMMLDVFVYDPNISAAKITAQIIKGVFRFVTAKVARPTPQNNHIRIPTACLGIRGTDVEVYVAADNSGYIKLYSGEVEMTNHMTGAVVQLKAEQMVTIIADGTLGEPTRITP